MNNVTINKQAKLSEHFTLAELCKTSVKTADGNIPSHVHIENLKRLCSWLERLRQRYNLNIKEKIKNKNDEPIIINSGYRSPQVNKAVGGAANSNHLTGCAVDIRCLGVEQALRYATTLLDISDKSKEDFDELLIEKSAKSIWVHFAVRPNRNRGKIAFLKV
jgi:hypothetical protein